MKFRVFSFVFCFLLTTTFTFAQPSSQTEAYFYYPADTQNKKNSWVMLLPGSSGLTVFDDKTFYNRQAESLAKMGYEVVLVDYKAFYQKSTDSDKPGKGTVGDKIAWVIRAVVPKTVEKIGSDRSVSGHIVGWSMAGEGIFKILKDKEFTGKNRIRSAALFYPSNLENQSISSSIPLLIQTGMSDTVVKAEELRKHIVMNENIEFVAYPDSYHGFDIDSLTKPKYIKFPPVFGRKHTFLYAEVHARSARDTLVKFLSK